MSKRKGVLSPFEGSFFNDCQIGPSFASFCPVAGVVPKPGLVQLFPTLLAVVYHWGPSRTVAGTPDRVHTGCEVIGYAAKASFSSSELLRKATGTTSSPVARETVLPDLPLSLGL